MASVLILYDGELETLEYMQKYCPCMFEDARVQTVSLNRMMPGLDAMNIIDNNGGLTAYSHVEVITDNPHLFHILSQGLKVGPKIVVQLWKRVGGVV